jgi:hypothetical protein
MFWGLAYTGLRDQEVPIRCPPHSTPSRHLLGAPTNQLYFSWLIIILKICTSIKNCFEAGSSGALYNASTGGQG